MRRIETLNVQFYVLSADQIGIETKAFLSFSLSVLLSTNRHLWSLFNDRLRRAKDKHFYSSAVLLCVDTFLPYAFCLLHFNIQLFSTKFRWCGLHRLISISNLCDNISSSYHLSRNVYRVLSETVISQLATRTANCSTKKHNPNQKHGGVCFTKQIYFIVVDM